MVLIRANKLVTEAAQTKQQTLIALDIPPSLIKASQIVDYMLPGISSLDFCTAPHCQALAFLHGCAELHCGIC